MADLGNTTALKADIDSKVFDNNTFEVSAEDLRSSFEDTIDTLENLDGLSQNLEEVLTKGSVAETPTDVVITKSLWKYVLGDAPIFVYDEAQSGDSYYKWSPSITRDIKEGSQFGARFNEEIATTEKKWDFQNDSGLRDGSFVHNALGLAFQSRAGGVSEDEVKFSVQTGSMDLNYASGLGATDNLTIKSLLGKTLISPLKKDAETPTTTWDINGDLRVRASEEFTSGSHNMAVLDSNGNVKYRKLTYTDRVETSGGWTLQPWENGINENPSATSLGFSLDPSVGIDGDQIKVSAPTSPADPFAYTQITVNLKKYKVLRAGDRDLVFIKYGGEWKEQVDTTASVIEWNREIATGGVGGTVSPFDYGSGHYIIGSDALNVSLYTNTGIIPADGTRIAFSTDATSSVNFVTTGAGSINIASMPALATVVLRYRTADLTWYVDSSHNI